MSRRTSRLVGGAAALIATWVTSGSAWACAVCFGNPESPLIQGAQKGIVTMLIVTYLVVIGTVGMIGFTVIRARRRLKRASGPGLQCRITGGDSDEASQLQSEAAVV